MSDMPEHPSDLSNIFGEFLIRRQRGESPILDEYCQRFPEFAEQLRQHVGLYDALGKAGSETDVRSSVNDLHDPLAPANAPKPAINFVPDAPRVQRLLEELASLDASPEEVCRSCPELLPQVRERWQQICLVRAKLDAVFPPPGHITPVSLEDPPESSRLPVVPGYKVEGVLGRGGMGVVFRARHLRLSRIVALKMTLAGVYAGSLERSRFQREAEAVAGLQHPNVVQVYDVGDSDGRPYFTMEYVTGGSLAQKLSGVPQPAREAATLVGALASAVHVAHQSEVVHRDLKPANVLLTVDGTPKISDFGLARRLDGDPGLTWTGTAVGTPSYMAPEQARGKKDAIGPATDIYSLGAILYEMLTGRPPFRAESAAATVEQVVTLDPVPPSRLNPTVPRDLETICLKCLQKEPRLRYATAAALADDLNCYLRGDSIAARPEGPLARLGRRVRRRPALAGALTLAIASTIALGGGGLWFYFDRMATETEQKAKAQAAEEDLHEMIRHLRASSWPEARAARDRAVMRLGNHVPAELRQLADQGTHDLDVSSRLEAIFVKGIESNEITFATYKREFWDAFRDAVGGKVGDDPEIVAGRIIQSDIRSALVIALDNYSWFMYAYDRESSIWAVNVAQKSDSDAPIWRVQARDPKVLGHPNALAEVIEKAPIDDPIVARLLAFGIYLSDPNRAASYLATLRQRQEAHPDDYWINYRFGNILTIHRNHAEAVGYLQAAVALRPKSAHCRFKLGIALTAVGRKAEAFEQLRRAIELNPTNPEYHLYFAMALRRMGQHAVAIEHLRRVIPDHPNYFLLHTELGICLSNVQENDEALVWFAKAVQIDPKQVVIARMFLMQRKRFDDVRVVWQAALAYNPPEHDAWYGYAELCLYLGKESEYIRARRDLLARFGASSDPKVAERTSRACLLLPETDEELRTAVTLTERAVSDERSKNQGAYPHFLFVKGLAEFRQGQFDKAISIMRGDASRVLGPAPRLVLAMALHKTGQTLEARKTLAAAVATHDWREDQVRDQDGCIYHVLRREAEGMILPNLPAFLAGKYQPQDNDERLAFLGVCQFTNRTLTLAHLYTGAFATDPRLTEDPGTGHRYSAARAAALVGCGHGADATGLGEEEKRHWRDQARLWLRADLAKLGKPQTDAAKRDRLKQWLVSWQVNTDLAGLREPAELTKLSEDERRDCLALWNEVADAIKRM